MIDSESLIKMHSSEEFKAQKNHFMKLTLDASNALRAAYSHAVIAKSYADNCMTIQSTDDFDQSVLAVSFLYDQGIHNPIKRELRYLIESMVKYVYIDQKNPEASLIEKVSLTNQLPPSIEMRKDIQLKAFHEEDRQHFVNELYDAYRQCCAYVHVSPKQVEERLGRRDRGGALGYETTDELRKLNRLIFRVYDIALTLYFHGYGLSLSGDLFIGYFDRLPDWVFRKGKYVSAFSAYFDYKVERRRARGDNAGGWDFDHWPPKRFSKA